MKAINVLFVSISGNTRAFAKRLTATAAKEQAKDSSKPAINAVEYDEQFDDSFCEQPYFIMVPTYLDGGNGISTGYREILTLDFRDELDDVNTDNLLGIVGSGNRNFNAQFGLTAKHYAKRYNSPLIGLYELRGNDEEALRIYTTMCKYQADFDKHGVKRGLVTA